MPGEAMTTKRLLDLQLRAEARGSASPLLAALAEIIADQDGEERVSARVDIAMPADPDTSSLKAQEVPARNTDGPFSGRTVPPGVPDSAALPRTAPIDRASGWSLAELADELALTPEDVSEVLTRISDAVAIPAPRIGDEVDGVVVELQWPAPGGGPGVAVGVEANEAPSVQAAGWQVVEPDDTAVLAALRAHQIITEEN